MNESVVNLAASALTSWKAGNVKREVDHYGNGESNSANKRARVEPTMMMSLPQVQGVEDPLKPRLKPHPFYYYTDHSTDPDPDPLTPLTFPGRVPNFPAKLHAMLSQPELAEIIDWLPHGRSWRVLKPRDFETKVIPKFFEHSKFSSFVRQANGWGFRRITQGPDRNSYYHEMFLRGLPHLCKAMKRPGVAEKRVVDPDLEPDFYKISQIRPVPAGADEESLFLQKTLQSGPKARMPIITGHFNKAKGQEGEDSRSQVAIKAEVGSPPATAAPYPEPQRVLASHEGNNTAPGAVVYAPPSPNVPRSMHAYAKGTAETSGHIEMGYPQQPPHSGVAYGAPAHQVHVAAPTPVTAASSGAPVPAPRTHPASGPYMYQHTGAASCHGAPTPVGTPLSPATHHAMYSANLAHTAPTPLAAPTARVPAPAAPYIAAHPTAAASAPAASAPTGAPQGTYMVPQPTAAASTSEAPAPAGTPSAAPNLHANVPTSTAQPLANATASTASSPGSVTPEYPPKIAEVNGMHQMPVQFPMPGVDPNSSASFAAGFAAATAHYQQQFASMLNSMHANKQLPEGFTPQSIMAGMTTSSTP